MSEPLSVCIAGATGWTGPALVRGVLDAPDLSLRSAVSRSAAGRDLGEALGGDALGVPVFAGVAEALDGIDVLVDFTSATAVEVNHQADAASRRGSSHVSAVTAAPSTASWTRLTRTRGRCRHRGRRRR